MADNLKYEVLEDDSLFLLGQYDSDPQTVYRIRALREIPLANGQTVKAGELGGYIYANPHQRVHGADPYALYSLAQDGNCWVTEHAMISGVRARVSGNMLITDQAHVHNVGLSGEGVISGTTQIRQELTQSRGLPCYPELPQPADLEAYLDRQREAQERSDEHRSTLKALARERRQGVAGVLREGRTYGGGSGELG